MPIYAKTEHDAQVQLNQLLSRLASELHLSTAGVRERISAIVLGPEPGNPTPYLDEAGHPWAWAVFTRKR